MAKTTSIRRDRLQHRITRAQRAQRAVALANAYEREHEREMREALNERRVTR